MGTKQENFREEYPAHIGYCRLDINRQAELTDDEFDDVCHRFNNGDHWRLGEMLDDLVDEVIAEREPK